MHHRGNISGNGTNSGPEGPPVNRTDTHIIGYKGSKSQINHGTKVCIKIGTVENYHYFNIININRYDVIIGTVFMKQHRIMLDFKKDQVRMRGKNLYMLCESMDEYLQVRRQVM